MVYAHKPKIKSLDAIVVDTDTTVTLFIDSFPVLHGVRDDSGRLAYNFHRLDDERYIANPNIIRKALDYVTHHYIGDDITMTDDEFRALPIADYVDADIYTQEWI
jgi:hypothetical protein